MLLGAATDTNPKRKRGRLVVTSLTLRVSMDCANLNRPQYSMAGLDLIRKMQGDFPVFFWGLCSFLEDFSENSGI